MKEKGFFCLIERVVLSFLLFFFFYVSVVLRTNNKIHYLLHQRPKIEIIIIKILEMFSIMPPVFFFFLICALFVSLFRCWPCVWIKHLMQTFTTVVHLAWLMCMCDEPRNQLTNARMQSQLLCTLVMFMISQRINPPRQAVTTVVYLSYVYDQSTNKPAKASSHNCCAPSSFRLKFVNSVTPNRQFYCDV